MRILLGVEALKFLSHPMHPKIYKALKKSLNASNKYLLSICIAFKQFFMHL